MYHLPVRRARRPSTAVRLLAAALAVLPLLLLAAAELSLRARRGPPPTAEVDELRRWNLDVHGPFFDEKDGARLLKPGFGPGTPFAAKKPAGVTRVFVAGESAAAELSRDLGFLGAVLATLYPRRRFELAAAGAPGFDSARARRLVDEVSRQSPDLVILLSGNNEYHPPSPPRALLAGDLWLSRFWVYRGFKELLPPSPPPPPDHARRMRDYEENLAAMVRGLRASGAAVVLCTLPQSALFPPRQTNRELWTDPAFLEALRLWERGRWKDAASALSAQSSGPPAAKPRYLRGLALLELGRRREAREALLEALELDSRPGTRSPPSRAALVRAVAEREGAVLADLAAAFEARAPGGLVGWETMLNNAHWHRDLNPAAFVEISAAVLAAGTWEADALPAAARARAWAGIRLQARAAQKPWRARAPEFWRQALCRTPLLRGERDYDEPLLAALSVLGGLDAAGLRALDSAEAAERRLEGLDCLPPGFGRYEAINAWPLLAAHLGEARRRARDLARARPLLEEGRSALPLPVERSLSALHADAGRPESARAALERMKALDEEEGRAWAEAVLP